MVCWHTECKEGCVGETEGPLERKNCQILVVDDDGAVRAMLVRVLNEEGYSVWQAADGEEALKIAAVMRFDLALLDLGLPGKGGWEMFKRLTLQNPLLAVIVITAKPNQRTIARSLGVRALFEKPLDFPVLLRTVANLFAESSQARFTPTSKAPEIHL